MTRESLCLITILLIASSLTAAASPRIAIIIDDLGYQRSAGERAIRLPGPVAFAFLPGAPRAAQLARLAHAEGKDVLLHLPLQATSATGSMEPDAIVLDTTQQEFRQVFAQSLASVPYVVGVNTHQGSLLTRHPGHMRWLMREIAMRGELFFVDSYTTKHSVALMIAQETGVPSVRRDVFLDHDRQPQTLVAEFERLKKIARRQGHAVGIGHPYPETLAFLERALPLLEDDGFQLVSISEVITEDGTVAARSGIKSDQCATAPYAKAQPCDPGASAVADR